MLDQWKFWCYAIHQKMFKGLWLNTHFLTCSSGINNPLPGDKFETLPNSNCLQMTISGMTKMGESYPNREKTLWEKEKLLVTSNFSFSHSVFKRLVSQGRQKVSLCGNGLMLDQSKFWCYAIHRKLFKGPWLNTHFLTCSMGIKFLRKRQ